MEEKEKIVVVKSLIYKRVKENKMRIGNDFFQKLSKKVEELVNSAMQRAKGHGKKTVTGIDL